MRQTLVSIWPVLVATALLILGNGALSTLLALQMVQAAFPSFVVGLVMSAYFVGLVFGAFYGHRLISGVGHIRAFAALASCFSAATLVHPFLVSAIPWAGLRFVEGFCLAGLIMCTESWLNARATNANRGRILSIYQITYYLAQGCGQFLLNLPNAAGFGLFVIASVLLSLSLVPIAAVRVEAPPLPAPSHFGFRELYSVSPLGVVGAFAAGMILGAFYGLGPYFARQVGLSLFGTTQFMGLVIFGGLLLQWPIGRVSDRFDRRTVLVGLAIAIALVSVGMVVTAGRAGVEFMGLGVLFGGVSFTLYPLCVAHANDQIKGEGFVRTSGGLIVAYGVGAALGPLGASALMNVQGPGALFAFTGVVALTTAVFAVWRMQRRAAVPLADQAEFQALPRTTPVLCEMDPRAEPEEAVFETPAPAVSTSEHP